VNVTDDGEVVAGEGEYLWSVRLAGAEGSAGETRSYYADEAIIEGGILSLITGDGDRLIAAFADWVFVERIERGAQSEYLFDQPAP
jgi:hypothetical protein